MAGLVNRQYTLDVNVQEAGAPEQSVNVRAWNIAETSVLDKTTDANGDVTSTVLTAEEYSLAGNALSAAISEDNAVFTDETTDANSATANDVTLMPAAAAATDRFYVGYSSEFPQVEINVGTAGAGTYTLAWSYWNGSTWAALTVEDGTDNFKKSGWNTIRFTEPGDWDTTTVNSQGPFYYIRCTRDAGTQTTQPLGTQLYVTTVTTTIRNPFRLRALKWLYKVLDVSINLSAPSKQTLFIESNTALITQTTQATVQAYTGITFNHTTDTVTLDGTGITPINDMNEFYDRCQDEAIVNEQYGPSEVLFSADKVNYVCEYDMVVDGFSMDGQSRAIAFATGKDLTVQGVGGIFNDITITGDYLLNTEANLQNVTVNGDLRVNTGANSTLSFTNVTVTGNVWNDATGNTLTINASGSSLTAGDPGTGNGQTNVVTSVPVSFTAVDEAGLPIQGVLITAYEDTGNPSQPSDPEVINTTTNASGVASTTYGGSTPQNIYYRYRKSSSGATKYVNLSGTDTIASGTGVAVRRIMREDTIADPTI